MMYAILLTWFITYIYKFNANFSRVFKNKYLPRNDRITTFPTFIGKIDPIEFVHFVAITTVIRKKLTTPPAIFPTDLRDQDPNVLNVVAQKQ